MSAQRSIGSRISIISAGLTLGLILQSAVGLIVFERVSEGIRLTSEHSVSIVASDTLTENIYYLRGNFMRHIIAQTPGEMAQIESENRDLAVKIHSSLDQMKASEDDEEDLAAIAQLTALTDRYLQSWDSVQSLSHENKSDEAVKLYNKVCVPIITDLVKQVSQFTDRQREQNQTVSGNLTKLAGKSMLFFAILSAVAAICAILGTWTAVRSINVVLRASMSDLQGAAEEIVGASGQVATASQSLADGCSQQAATIEETSSASKEINAMAQRSAENSRNATDVVSGSRDRAEQTNRSLAAMVSAMERIGGSSQKISKIIKVIDEIAFQTNILALNAAVEAARAGEAGMGFAVVADEVRALAQRSAQAARDTSELIEDSIRQSNEGKVMVDKVAGDIHLLTSDSNRIKAMVDEITQGSAEQSRGTDQISRSIHSMESATQHTAANAEESSSAARELQAQAQSLKQIVATIAALVEGADGARTGELHRGVRLAEVSS